MKLNDLHLVFSIPLQGDKAFRMKLGGTSLTPRIAAAKGIRSGGRNRDKPTNASAALGKTCNRDRDFLFLARCRNLDPFLPFGA
jgi:hypothetical protein